MITPIPLLQSVRVASPCNADWNEMQAVEGERVHFCMGCGKNVYNLSAMSQSEAEGLLRKHEGRLCVRYYQRRDGTVLTGDCPVGAQAVRMALIRRSAVAAGLFTLMFGAMAGINRAEMQQARTPVEAVNIAPQPIAGGVSIQIEEPRPEPVMGKRAVSELPMVQGIVSMPAPPTPPADAPVVMGDVEVTPPPRSEDYNGPMKETQPVPSADTTDEALLKPRKGTTYR